MYKKWIAVFICMLISEPAFAGHFVSAGYASAENDGAEVSLGYAWRQQSVEVMLSYLSGVLYPEEDTRYREEAVSGGNTICRDTTNGQFADSEKCDSTGFDYAPSLEARYFLNEKDSLGIGFRGGSESTVYAVYLRDFSEFGFFQLKAGSDYTEAGVGWRF